MENTILTPKKLSWTSPEVINDHGIMIALPETRPRTVLIPGAINCTIYVTAMVPARAFVVIDAF